MSNKIEKNIVIVFVPFKVRVVKSKFFDIEKNKSVSFAVFEKKKIY
jgi:hypothetical protein